MAFGKEIFYQDAYSTGTNNTRYFAEDINEFIMAMQGNYVVSGCDVTVGAETNLGVSGNHLAVASGVAFVNGAVRTIGSTNIDLSTAFAALSAGESRFIQVYITAAGAVSTQSGDIVTDGNQLPEVSSTGWTIANTTPLAWVYLTASDTTMSANQIFNQIVYAPTGLYINGDAYVNASQVIFQDENDSDVTLFDYDLLNRTIQSGASADAMAWTHYGDMDIYSPNQVRIYDPDDSNALLFDFDTTNRTIDFGTNGGVDLITHFYSSNTNRFITIDPSRAPISTDFDGHISIEAFAPMISFIDRSSSALDGGIWVDTDLMRLGSIVQGSSVTPLIDIDLATGDVDMNGSAFVNNNVIAPGFVPASYINATAVDIAAQIHDNSTNQYGTETISGALNKYFEMQFSIPAFTGTESLSGSENVAVQFQTNVGAGWVTQSTCNITPSGYGSWSSSTFTVQFSESGTFQWRLNLIETNQDTGVNGYNPDSFTPTYKVALKT